MFCIHLSLSLSFSSSIFIFLFLYLLAELNQLGGMKERLPSGNTVLRSFFFSPVPSVPLVFLCAALF